MLSTHSSRHNLINLTRRKKTHDEIKNNNKNKKFPLMKTLISSPAIFSSNQIHLTKLSHLKLPTNYAKSHGTAAGISTTVIAVPSSPTESRSWATPER